MPSVTSRDAVKQRAVAWWRNRTVENYTRHAKLWKSRDVPVVVSKKSATLSDKANQQPWRAPFAASAVTRWEMRLKESGGMGPLLPRQRWPGRTPGHWWLDFIFCCVSISLRQRFQQGSSVAICTPSGTADVDLCSPPQTPILSEINTQFWHFLAYHQCWISHQHGLEWFVLSCWVQDTPIFYCPSSHCHWN